jgi:solute carrier family 35 protein E1
MHNNIWAKDEKQGFKDIGSRASSMLAILKNYLSRHLPYPRQMTRAPVMTTKSSLTNPPPASSNAIFILLCGLWYTTSALSSNTGKAILTQFRYPVTLTFIQFGFVALYCLLFMSPLIRFSRIRMPTKSIARSTLPMGMFQVGGHMFSSMAISRIPVSTVHTIKVGGLH